MEFSINSVCLTVAFIAAFVWVLSPWRQVVDTKRSCEFISEKVEVQEDPETKEKERSSPRKKSHEKKDSFKNEKTNEIYIKTKVNESFGEDVKKKSVFCVNEAEEKKKVCVRPISFKEEIHEKSVVSADDNSCLQHENEGTSHVRGVMSVESGDVPQGEDQINVSCISVNFDNPLVSSTTDHVFIEPISSAMSLSSNVVVSSDASHTELPSSAISIDLNHPNESLVADLSKDLLTLDNSQDRARCRDVLNATQESVSPFKDDTKPVEDNKEATTCLDSSVQVTCHVSTQETECNVSCFTRSTVQVESVSVSDSSKVTLCEKDIASTTVTTNEYISDHDIEKAVLCESLSSEIPENDSVSQEKPIVSSDEDAKIPENDSVSQEKPIVSSDEDAKIPENDSVSQEKPIVSSDEDAEIDKTSSVNAFDVDSENIDRGSCSKTDVLGDQMSPDPLGESRFVSLSTSQEDLLDLKKEHEEVDNGPSIDLHQSSSTITETEFHTSVTKNRDESTVLYEAQTRTVEESLVDQGSAKEHKVSESVSWTSSPRPRNDEHVTMQEEEVPNGQTSSQFNDTETFSVTTPTNEELQGDGDSDLKPSDDIDTNLCGSEEDSEIMFLRIKRRAIQRVNKVLSPPKEKTMDSTFSKDPTTNFYPDDPYLSEEDCSDDDLPDNLHLDEQRAAKMNDEERQKEAEMLKCNGNNLFKDREYLKAARKYTEAMIFSPTAAITAVLLCNRAACYLLLKEYHHVVKDCNDGIFLDPDYIKLYLRRFRAYEAMEKWHEALKDLNKTLELDPSLRDTYQHLLQRIQYQSELLFEKEKEEMVKKLKGFGNWALGKFGLSIDNFKVEQNQETGSYNISFQNNP